MKVLLWQDVDKLGKRGEVVDVRDGYARNFLFPRRLASDPTPSMYKILEQEKRRQSKLEAVVVSGAREIAEKLAGIASVSIEVNTNEQGLLYGAINPSMVADALRAQGLKIEPRMVEIGEPIKQVGTYEVTIHLHREIQPKVKVWVLSTKAVKPPEPAAPAKAEEKPADPAQDKKTDAAPPA